MHGQRVSLITSQMKTALRYGMTLVRLQNVITIAIITITITE